MADKEQVRPLAPAAPTRRIFHLEEDEALSIEMSKYHNRRCLICCGCIVAILLIIAVIALILAVTAFHVKDPVLKLNSVTIQGFDMALSASGAFRPGANLTLVADVSVKNPNVASFKYNSVKTRVYYDGRIIGEAVMPAGIARPRQTLSSNVIIIVLVDRILTVPRLASVLIFGGLPINTYTEISGQVKILKIVKRDVNVGMNCTMFVDVMKRSIEDQICQRSKVST